MKFIIETAGFLAGCVVGLFLVIKDKYNGVKYGM